MTYDARATNDEKLVVLYRQTKNQRYFEELHRRFQPEIAAFAARLLSNRPEIDDEAVVNDVFTAFHNYCQSTQPIRPVRAWLHNGARLRIVEAVRNSRRKKRGGGKIFHSIFEWGIFDKAGSPEEQAQQKEQIIMLREAIASLSPFNQSILKLVYVETLSLSQAAARLGVAKKTIQRHLNTIRELLRLRILAIT